MKAADRNYKKRRKKMNKYNFEKLFLEISEKKSKRCM